MYAVVVDGTMYVFDHSPLGVLSANARWIGETTRWGGVRLLQRRRSGDPWRPVQWPAHLWWTRLLMVAHVIAGGTRLEGISDLRYTSRFLRWWLRNTPTQGRARPTRLVL